MANLSGFGFPQANFDWLGQLPSVMREEQARATQERVLSGFQNATPDELRRRGAILTQTPGLQGLGMQMIKQADEMEYHRAMAPQPLSGNPPLDVTPTPTRPIQEPRPGGDTGVVTSPDGTQIRLGPGRTPRPSGMPESPPSEEPSLLSPTPFGLQGELIPSAAGAVAQAAAPAVPAARAAAYRSGGGQTIDDIVTAAAVRHGVDADFMRRTAKIESGGNPYARTGSYLGLFQLDRPEFRAGGGRNIFDPSENADVAAAKFAKEKRAFEERNGRAATPIDQYMIHQQGAAGYQAHLDNPDQPAWMSMASTGEGRQKGAGWARRAIWGNIPDQYKAQFGNVNNVTSRDFVAMWNARFNGTDTGGGGAPYTPGPAPATRVAMAGGQLPAGVGSAGLSAPIGAVGRMYGGAGFPVLPTGPGSSPLPAGPDLVPPDLMLPGQPQGPQGFMRTFDQLIPQSAVLPTRVAETVPSVGSPVPFTPVGERLPEPVGGMPPGIRMQRVRPAPEAGQAPAVPGPATGPGAPAPGPEFTTPEQAHATDMANRWGQYITKNQHRLPAQDIALANTYLKYWLDQSKDPNDPRIRSYQDYIRSGGNMPRHLFERMQEVSPKLILDAHEALKPISERALAAGKEEPILRQMSEMAKDPDLITGRWSQFPQMAGEAVSTLLNAAKSWGLASDDTINAWKSEFGSLTKASAKAEMFQSLQNQLALIRLEGKLGAQVSNTDREFVTDIFPKLTHTKEGIKLLSEIMLAMNKRDKDVAKFGDWYVNEAAPATATRSGLTSAIGQWTEKNPLFLSTDKKTMTDLGKRLQAFKEANPGLWDKEHPATAPVPTSLGPPPAGPSLEDLEKEQERRRKGP